MTFDALSTSLVFWEVLAFLMRRRDRARGVLDRRYASGEMTREEYLTIRDDIKRYRDA